jgi:hypothetical protein
MQAERKRGPTGLPSDGLRHLLDLRDEFPLFRELMRDVIQVVLVLDASAIQAELRWRLGSRINPSARTRLHEAIESGVVVAFAPPFLKHEIEEHLPTIANDTEVTLETGNIEWKRVQSLIRFYAPIGNREQFASVDPKDSDYALAVTELNADFVRTTDPHFERMGVPTIGPELDAVLRDYARATSILVTVKVGSGFALIFGIRTFVEVIRAIVQAVRRLPPIAKTAIATGILLAVLHPTSREKLAVWGSILWGRLQQMKPILVSVSQNAAKHMTEVVHTSKQNGRVIESKLRPRSTKTALDHIGLIFLRANEPLEVDEIARRILANGYSSQSKTFTGYVRRLLKQDRRFAANSEGLWTLRAAA